MKVAIDAAACTGHGRCYAVAPDVFDADALGNGVVRQAEVPPALEASARRAAESCPERAISIVESSRAERSS